MEKQYILKKLIAITIVVASIFSHCFGKNANRFTNNANNNNYSRKPSLRSVFAKASTDRQGGVYPEQGRRSGRHALNPSIEMQGIKAKAEHWITVFSHGIISAAPLLSFDLIGRMMKNNLKGTFYEKYVYNVRRDRYFCQNQPMQELGLKIIDTQRTDADDGCPAMAQIFDLQSSWLHPDKKINNYYYTFGWEALLIHESRYEDAKKLHIALSQEIKKYRDRGINPKIRLIGFSHGASVLLNLGGVRQNENIEKNFEIDELILLGMPVQRNSDNYINAPLFKKVYNFYSKYDRIQVLDFSNPGKLFSRRKFKRRPNLQIPTNLMQVRLEMLRHNPKQDKWIKNSKKYRENIRTGKLLPRHSHGVRNSSPGHCEWWFFGWTNKYYRDNFSIYPLPILALIPTIIDTINNTDLTYYYDKKLGNHLTLRLIPFQERMIIQNKYAQRTIDFLTENQLNQLKDVTKAFPFKKVTQKEYATRVDSIIEETKEEMSVQLAKTKKKSRRSVHRKRA